MKSSERHERCRHVEGALGLRPGNGARVHEGLAALVAATAALDRAELDFVMAAADAREATAHVRDATRACATECKKARGTLVGEGADLRPRSLPVSRLPRPMLRRAELIVSHAESKSIELRALAAAHDVLEAALVALAGARAAKRAAGTAQTEARAKHDATYALLRTEVEAELRREGLTGPTLRERLGVYFKPIGV